MRQLGNERINLVILSLLPVHSPELLLPVSLLDVLPQLQGILKLHIAILTASTPFPLFLS